ncbi:MAG: aminopeptidase, partial [Planctomycetaceae bacterium]
LLLSAAASGQAITNSKYRQADKFRQLEELLPTPNDYRTASGAPGHRYWQQKVDYQIDVELDDATQRISGREVITYTNNSPDTLHYLWLQLDANIKHPQSGRALAAPAPSLAGGLSYNSLDMLLTGNQFDGSVKVKEVLDVASGVPLPHVVVKTSLRVDLPRALKTGEQFRFSIAWEYAINNSKVSPGRTGYEYFEEDKNYLYEMAQWFPRLCAYSDAVGWQH